MCDALLYVCYVVSVVSIRIKINESNGALAGGNFQARIGISTVRPVESVMWQTTYVELLKGHIVMSRCNSV